MDPIKDLIEDRSVTLKNIFFEFDKATIRPEAALGLDRIVEVLKEYPDVVLRIESHTDRRGPAEYNKNLSQRRAQSTVDYIVSQGIDASRLSAVGKGEEEPLNDCADGCTEDEHEENRRSEFIIVE
jgi:outer membrane protein OmpA-like peptidoglycan-associated protein